MVAEHHIREQEVLKEGKIQDYPSEEYVDHHGNKKILHLIKVPLMDAGPNPWFFLLWRTSPNAANRKKKFPV